MKEKDALDRPRLVLVTGLSGSGKSTAAKALEDAGYYCVHNLPWPLLKRFLSDPVAQVGGRRPIALVTDVRAAGFAESVPQLLLDVDRKNFRFVVLFLEASEESLVRRFSETRRSHPLGDGDRPLIEGIRREKELLSELRGQAGLVFDTTDWSVHDARREIYREFTDSPEEAPEMVVSLVSFGFKHGIPSTSDLLFDVRFLANPYFHPHLRELSGKDAPVREFLEAQDEFGELCERLTDLLLFLLPRFRRDNRSYVSLAIGCTGGRHRSVATAEYLNKVLSEKGWTVRLKHRDCER